MCIPGSEATSVNIPLLSMSLISCKVDRLFVCLFERFIEYLVAHVDLNFVHVDIILSFERTILGIENSL